MVTDVFSRDELKVAFNGGVNKNFYTLNNDSALIYKTEHIKFDTPDEYDQYDLYDPTGMCYGFRYSIDHLILK